MYQLKNSHWQASTLIRGLLTIIFIFWLASVMSHYDEKTPAKKPEITHKQPPSNIVIEQMALPPLPKPKPKLKSKPESKPQVSAEAKNDKQLAERVTKVVNQIPETPPVNRQQIEQVYQKLSIKGIDIQIAWPQRHDERQDTLQFMYQCVGVQFAVLNGTTLYKTNHNKTEHTKLNQNNLNQVKVTDYSDWIRVAQGSLSRREHNWLNAYDVTGTPIRLFPRHLDWRLAQHLANALKGEPLISLRANYQLTNQSLQLTNIYLNKQRITANWGLYQGKC